jgi:hypothetical protein
MIVLFSYTNFIYDTSAVIGRPFPSSGIGSGSANGKVIILKCAGPSWTNVITYTVETSDKRDGDYFGADVAISGKDSCRCR